MKWEHIVRGFRYNDNAELNEDLAKWGEAGWEAVGYHWKHNNNENASKKFYASVMFKRMKPLEVNGDID